VTTLIHGRDQQKEDSVTTANPPEPTPGWVVAVLGVLLLPLAAGAFILSFVQLLPVMLFGGWDSSTAWLGPVVLDVTAAAGAVMHVVSRDRQVRAWGLGLLAGGTALSIAGNLAGHAITTPGAGARVPLPEHMAGWALPAAWQWVVAALSVAVPLSVAVLVHAFGAVLTAWLTTRPAAAGESAAADSSHPTRAAADPTPLADPTRPDPTRAPDSTVAAQPIGPDSVGQSGADPLPTDPTRLASDSGADLRESGESGAESDPTDHPTPQPTADPTRPGVGYPTDPTATRPDSSDRPDSQPTGSADPTPDPTARPDSEPATDPADDELTRLVEQARELVESGRIRPTADAIRVALEVGQKRSREIRDALKDNHRHGLRAVS
jgi:hypothetical protein